MQDASLKSRTMSHFEVPERRFAGRPDRLLVVLLLLGVLLAAVVALSV